MGIEQSKKLQELLSLTTQEKTQKKEWKLLLRLKHNRIYF